MLAAIGEAGAFRAMEAADALETPHLAVRAIIETARKVLRHQRLN
jgi:hypothetical protein